MSKRAQVRDPPHGIPWGTTTGAGPVPPEAPMHPTAPPRNAPPSSLACPGCTGPVPPVEPACPTCRLPLRGPVAARLWEVDTELAGLAGRAVALRRERADLLGLLRASAAPEEAPPPRVEWGLRRVQSTLLGAGALLLCVAATVFAAVTYDDLGLVGQSLVLLTLTAAAAASVGALARRGLAGTGEAMAAVTLALALLDVHAARRVGLAGLDDVDGRAYWAVATGLLAVASAGAAARLPGLRLPGLAAVALAQAPVLAVGSGVGSSAAVWLLAGQAGLDVLALAALQRSDRGGGPRVLPPRALGTAGLVLGGLAALTAGTRLLDAALIARPGSSPLPAALALVALAGLALVAAPLPGGRTGREGVGALPVLLAAAAVAGLLLARGQDAPATALALAGVGAAGAALAAAAVGRVDWSRGPQRAALAVVAAAVALVAGPAAVAVAGPLTWPTAPWSVPAAASARSVVSPGLTWTGDLSVVGVLALAAAALVSVARSRSGRARLAASLLGAASAWAALVALPLALDVAFAAALAALVVTGAALLALGLARGAARGADALLLAGAASLALGSAWAAASEPATLVVVPLAAALLGVGSLADARARAALLFLAGTTAGVAVAAFALSLGAPADRAGFLLLAVPAGLLALAAQPGPGRDRALAAEGAAVVLGTAAGVLTAEDPGWFAWTLAVTGLVSLATALRRDRRRVAYLGGLLLASSTWVRLGEAGVEAPEPYVVPAALVALALGHLRRRRSPGLSSRAAYAPGLAGLLLPSLLATFGDPGLLRPLLLGAVALTVTLAGARTRLAAPLVAGPAVLAVLALQQLAPLADALPRWTALAAAGAVLLAVGATYEQRRRDLERLREAYRALD